MSSFPYRCPFCWAFKVRSEFDPDCGYFHTCDECVKSWADADDCEKNSKAGPFEETAPALPKVDAARV